MTVHPADAPDAGIMLRAELFLGGFPALFADAHVVLAAVLLFDDGPALLPDPAVVLRAVLLAGGHSTTLRSFSAGSWSRFAAWSVWLLFWLHWSAHVPALSRSLAADGAVSTIPSA